MNLNILRQNFITLLAILFWRHFGKFIKEALGALSKLLLWRSNIMTYHVLDELIFFLTIVIQHLIKNLISRLMRYPSATLNTGLNCFRLCILFFRLYLFLFKNSLICGSKAFHFAYNIQIFKFAYVIFEL